MKNWSGEDWGGGAPTVTMQPGTLAAWPALREPHDRVHFAGTETATQWIGWVVMDEDDDDDDDDDDQVHGRRGGERDEGRLGGSQHHQASVTLTSRTQGNLANGILSSL